MSNIEREIPQLIRQGKDSEVIALFYKQVYPRVKKSILKRGGRREDIEDVFQESLMYLYKQVLEHTFNEKYTVYGFLYTHTMHRWMNSLRNKDRYISVDFQGNSAYDNISADYQDVYPASKEGNLLNELFAGIGSICIEMLTYTIYQNLMMEDIQIRMGFETEGAAKMKLKRCREKLYKEMEKNPHILQKLKGHA